MRKILFYVLLLVFLLMAVGETLWSIPAFGRKYKMSCNVCHSPFPRLKDYGVEFAANGFVLKDQDAPRYFRDTGDEKLSLIKELPIAIRLEGYAIYNNAGTEKADFASPYVMKLLSGGNLAKNISYYLYFLMGERGEVAGLEDAFIMFSDILKSGITLSVGQFQVSDPIFKRELRLTFEDYQVYTAKPGLSNIDLTYDRGLMFTFGIEKTGTDIALEVLNGCGIGEADAFKSFDTDKYKNLFGRLSQAIGSFIRLGGSGYYGKEEQDGKINKVWMWGADLTLDLKILEFNLQYLERNDDNAVFNDFSCPCTEVNTRGAFAEIIFTPRGDKSDWYAVLLYNWVDSDSGILDYRSFSGHIGILLRRNIRLTAEVTRIFKGPQEAHTRAGIGLVTAF